MSVLDYHACMWSEARIKNGIELLAFNNVLTEDQ